MTPAKSDYLSQNADIMTSPTPALFNDDFTAAFPQTTMAPALVSDHPVLDDLFSELTRSESRHDLSHFHHSHQSHQRSVPKSEPVDLADMERILLQPPKKSSSKIDYLILLLLTLDSSTTIRFSVNEPNASSSNE